MNEQLAKVRQARNRRQRAERDLAAAMVAAREAGATFAAIAAAAGVTRQRAHQIVNERKE
jgi:predicted transcriptional regulator